MEIAYYIDINSMGDNVTEADADGYREWATTEIKKAFPSAQVEVSDKQDLKGFFCNDEDMEEEVSEFLNTLWDKCPWSWVALND